MAKYTEEQLIGFQEEAHVPQPETLEAFNQLVETVREHAAAELEKHKNIKWGNGDTYIDERGNERSYHHLNRRRGSHSAAKPVNRKKSVGTVVDEDGWATMVTKKSFGAEEAGEERAKFRESLKEGGAGSSAGGFKARPNNKNLGSSKALDPRDATADKQVKAFNAFAALDGDESDEDDDSDDE